MAEKAVQRKNQALPESTTTMIQYLLPQIGALLPADITVPQFRSALWLELTERTATRDCSLQSIKTCAIKAATYGLLPGRDCHFLPFTVKGQKQATFVENYFGVLLMLDRTGKVRDAFAHPVYGGDVFVCNHLAGVYDHIPGYTMMPPQAQGKLRFFYACILLTGGDKHVEPMTLDEIDAVRRRSPAAEAGPWVTDYIEMAKKTVLRRASKYVKGAPRLQQLLQEAEARERLDIPEARHQDNMAALYNMGTDTPTDPKPARSLVHQKTAGFTSQEEDNPLFDMEESARIDREEAAKER